MPCISVIIPAYNSERFIRETLDCLLSQTLKDIEIIVVNDGSTDLTQAIVDGYCEQYGFIHSYQQENAGVSAARNFGLTKATGDYVVFLDADDLYTEGSLQAFYDTAVKTGADCVIGRLRNFDENGMGKFNPFGEKLSKKQSISTFDTDLLWNFLVSNKCYNRKTLLESKVVFPPFTFSEEGAFFMSFVYTGAKLAGTTGACMCYRRHTVSQGFSVSQTVSKKNAENMLGSLHIVLEKAREALEKTDANVNKEAYMQQIIYKTAYILVSQFYRCAWRGDDECFRYVAGEIRKLKQRLSPDIFRLMCEADRDLCLDNLCGTKQEMASRAQITVILKPKKGKYYTAFLNSLYLQVCPMFQLVVPEDFYETMPGYIKKQANVTIVENGHYGKKARQAATAKQIVTVSSAKPLDERLFRVAAGVRSVPYSIRTRFFPWMLFGIKLLLKRV